MPRLVRSPRRRSWWLLLAFVALLVLSGCGNTPASNPPSPGGGGVVDTATPAPDPTAVHIDGWQTYSDKTYAFTIQYPPKWTALLEPQPQGTPYEIVGIFQASAAGGAPPTQNIITITVQQNQPDTGDNGTPPGFAPSGSVNVGGSSQPLLVGPGSAGGQGLLVTFAQNNDIFVFYSTADSASATNFQQVFTQMLSTFQQQPAQT
jgi:hypothetical protein